MARLQNVTVNGLVAEIGARYRAAETNQVIPSFDRIEQLEDMEVILADIFEAGDAANDKLMMATLFVAVCRFMANNADDNNLLTQIDAAIDWTLLSRTEPAPPDMVVTGPAIDPSDTEAVEDFEEEHRQDNAPAVSPSIVCAPDDETPLNTDSIVQAPTMPSPPSPVPKPQPQPAQPAAQQSKHPIVMRNLERMKGKS